MQDFQVIPQEIVHEIFEYIPEYGHRVSACLHERSKGGPTVSAYCDFLRYCGRKDEDDIIICIDILDLHKSLPDDLVDHATRYLKKKLRLVIYAYLERLLSMSVDIFEQLGIARAAHFSEIHDTDRCGSEWHTKIIELYVLMILRDNGLLTKKDFDTEIAGVSDMAIILELILAQWTYYEHIHCLVIRYFGHADIINVVIERLKNESAITEGIIVAELYYYGSDQLTQQLSYQKISTSIERNKLVDVRNQLLDIVPVHAYYEVMGRNAHIFHKLLFMIESMADEE